MRNIALIGHGHSGKTAIVDALIQHTKSGPRSGGVAEASSSSGSEPEERERKHTLVSHLFRIPSGKVRVNVLDTPGHPDFIADALSSLQAVEVACLVLNAAAPISFHARQLWQRAGEMGLARAIVVTHLDHDGTNFEQLIVELRALFGHAVAPVTYPEAPGHDFKAVRNVLTHHGPRADKYHEWIEEDEAEVDDTIMEHYLAQGHLDAKEFEQNLGRAMAKGKLVPVFAVAPTTGVGVDTFLTFVAEHFPSPVEFGARGGSAPGKSVYSEMVAPLADAPFLAQVFKIVIDPYVGRLAWARCLRGSLKVDQSVVDVRSHKSHKIAHLLDVHGKDVKEIGEVQAGDVFGISKLEDLDLGDTLAVESALLELPRQRFPEPTYSRHVWPKSRGDEAKIGQALDKLCTEDPTLHHRRDKDTGELLVDGMSPL
ncbi:MAG: GTP-binding protein, partial [Planctomycetota bacterium]